jgi:hypothetical protein
MQWEDMDKVMNSITNLQHILVRQASAQRELEYTQKTKRQRVLEPVDPPVQEETVAESCQEDRNTPKKRSPISFRSVRSSSK